MDLEQALAKIKELEKDKTTLINEKVSAMAESASYKEKFDAEVSKNKEVIASRDKVKASLKSISEVFGAKEGATTEELISLITEFKTTADNTQKDFAELSPYKEFKPHLDELITNRSKELETLLDKFKDNEIAMSFVNFNKETDSKDLAKINEAYKVLTNLTAFSGGEKTKPNQNPFNFNKDSLLDKKKNENEPRFDVSKL